MLKSKPALKKLSPYQQGRQTDEVKSLYGLDKIVKLASNENPYGYSVEVDKMFSEMKNDFHIYPDGHTSELRKALAAKLNVNENQLLFAGGSDEIIQIIGRAFLYPGVNTVMAAPTFPQYKQSAVIEGAEVREVATTDGYHDLDGMLKAINDNTSVVWLCTPNNPTGTLIDKEALYHFMDNCPRHVLVVLDEAYYEYVDPELDSNAISRLSDYPNLIILRTFSKAYGLAGLRMGYGIADSDLITSLDVVRGPFNTSSVAQRAALAALSDEQFINETVQKNKEVKLNLQQFLLEIGWHFYDSETNFLSISTPVNSEEVFEYFLKNGFIVRPFQVSGTPGMIRVTIGKKEEMDKFVELLEKFHRQAGKAVQK